MTTDSTRVGGRPGSPPPRTGGGGYPDTCTNPRSAVRPPDKNFAKNHNLTLKDLRDMGLPPHWLEVAEHIGVELWMGVWQILDRDNITQPGNFDPVRLRVPRFSRTLRYVRNRLIAELSQQGLDEAAIAAEIARRNMQPIQPDSIKLIVREFQNDK